MVSVLGSYRSKLDIIADILTVVKGNGTAKKTQIMYGANLSYTVLSRYLAEVLNACLLKFEGSKCHYVLTEKGKRFLQHYREYSKRNRHVERQLETVNAKRKVLEELCTA